MATIDDKALIDEIIRGNGYYMDDPRVNRIVEYTNMAGKRTWGITYRKSEKEKYTTETQFIRNPVVLWDAI